MMANRSDIPLRTAWEFDFEARPEDDADALRRLVADLGPSEATAGAAGGHWSYSNAGWCVLGRVVETVTGPLLGGSDAEPAGRPAGHVVRRHAGRELRGRARGLRSRPGSRDDRPIACVCPGRDDHRLDGCRLAAVGWLAPRSTRARSTARGARGGAHQRLARRVVPGMGAVRLGAGARVGLGRADRRSTVVPPPAARAPGGRRPAHQQQPRTRPVPDAGPPVDEGPVRDRRPSAAPAADAGCGGRARPLRRPLRVAGPRGRRTRDRRGSDDRRRGAHHEGAAPRRPDFLVDPGDPDNPTTTFGAFDAAGRPEALYDMLWGLPRIAG